MFVHSSAPITVDDIIEAVNRAEEIKRFQELKEKQMIKDVVLICNRENKYKINCAIPDICILGTDVCDDKIYMVMDKELAENIRRVVKG